ncbi:MAG: hypothetical protein DRQ35_04730 [Gammaproteobacteria bacterium]|nr:MAG: hypothetical protein DRQ35_04730 [Gammaproteobacteria bacterium]
MSNAPTNIYPLVVFDIHKRIREYIDKLNEEGQIDQDSNGYPYLIKVDGNGSNHTVQIVRNNKIESFLINTRKRQDPITSWNANDGYKNQSVKQTVDVPSNVDADRSERAKRESYDNIVDKILK